MQNADQAADLTFPASLAREVLGPRVTDAATRSVFEQALRQTGHDHGPDTRDYSSYAVVEDYQEIHSHLTPQSQDHASLVATGQNAGAPPVVIVAGTIARDQLSPEMAEEVFNSWSNKLTDRNEIGRLEEILDELDEQNTGDDTKHYRKWLPPGSADRRAYTHITPVSSDVARMVQTIEDDTGQFRLHGVQDRRREQLDPLLQQEVFAPRSGVLTPGNAQPSEAGATIILEQHQGAFFSPESLADRLRIPSNIVQDIVAQGILLDKRYNEVDATIQETLWSLKVWQSAPSKDLDLFQAHIALVIEQGSQIGVVFEQRADTVPEERREFYRKGFRAIGPISERLAEWSERRDPIKMCEIVVDQDIGYKKLIDALGTSLGAAYLPLSVSIRESSLFTDRGRQYVPLERQRSDSRSNRHGGITEGQYRLPQMENIFSTDIFHHKSVKEPDLNSQTVKRFQNSGAPYVGGVAGTVEQALVIMERSKDRTLLMPEELDQRERVIRMYVAAEVLGGHHSVVESVKPAQHYGYFANMPDPLGSRDNYRTMMTMLMDRPPSDDQAALSRPGRQNEGSQFWQSLVAPESSQASGQHSPRRGRTL